jgi:hypothetical protein
MKPMPVQIAIQDNQADLMIDFYVNRLKTLREEILARENETKLINNLVQQLKKRDTSMVAESMPSYAISNRPDYSEDWPWMKKILFALNNSPTPMTSKEIVGFLTDYEPVLLFDKKRAIASVSSILSTKSGKGKTFVRTEKESGDFAYQLSKPN